MIRRGLDSSNYSGAITVDQFKGLKDAGFDWLIAGAQVGKDGANYTQQQIDNARAAGIEVIGVYELLYWDARDHARIIHAQSFDLPVWLDCETDVPAGMLPEQVVERIAAEARFLGQQCAGIYTGRWWWGPQTRDSKDFSGLPLWHAEYGPEPFTKFTPYGGWQAPTIWQYSSDGLNGVTVDLNAWQVPDPAPVAGPTRDEQLDAVSALLQFIIHGLDYRALSVPHKAALRYWHETAEGK